jgi:hypothetical protein
MTNVEARARRGEVTLSSQSPIAISVSIATCAAAALKIR